MSHNDIMKIYSRFQNITKEANDRKSLLEFYKKKKQNRKRLTKQKWLQQDDTDKKKQLHYITAAAHRLKEHFNLYLNLIRLTNKWNMGHSRYLTRILHLHAMPVLVLVQNPWSSLFVAEN